MATPSRESSLLNFNLPPWLRPYRAALVAAALVALALGVFLFLFRNLGGYFSSGVANPLAPTSAAEDPLKLSGGAALLIALGAALGLGLAGAGWLARARWGRWAWAALAGGGALFLGSLLLAGAGGGGGATTAPSAPLALLMFGLALLSVILVALIKPEYLLRVLLTSAIMLALSWLLPQLAAQSVKALQERFAEAPIQRDSGQPRNIGIGGGGAPSSGFGSASTSSTLENGFPLNLAQGGAFPVSGVSLSPEGAKGLTHLPVFAVEGAEGVRYLRTLVADTYNGKQWRTEIESGALNALQGRNLPTPAEAAGLTFRQATLTISPLGEGKIGPGYLPAPLYPAQINAGSGVTLETETWLLRTGNAFADGYELLARVPVINPARLAAQPAGAEVDAYRQLPGAVSERTRELAAQITQGRPTPYAQAQAIEDYLKANYAYDFGYLNAPPGVEPTDWFLFQDQRGVCANFSNAFVLLARAVGLPARPVAGWAITPTGARQLVYTDQAHQWAEVYFPNAGWVTFDPTPPGGAPDRAPGDFSSPPTGELPQPQPGVVPTPDGGQIVPPTPRPAALPGQTPAATPAPTPGGGDSPDLTPGPGDFLPQTPTPAPGATPGPGKTPLPGNGPVGGTPGPMPILTPGPGDIPLPGATPAPGTTPIPVPDPNATPGPGQTLVPFPDGTPPPGKTPILVPGPDGTPIPLPPPDDTAPPPSTPTLAPGPGLGDGAGDGTQVPVPAGPVPTFTDITGLPERLRLGAKASVTGTVSAANGSVVDGPEVEILLNETKEHGGLQVGKGEVSDGAFNVTITIPVDLPPGDYQVLAHTIGNASYADSWSDPAVSVFSGTQLEVTGPTEVPINQGVQFTGILTEETGEPLPGQTIAVSIDGEPLSDLTTDAQGRFSFNFSFADPGPHRVNVAFAAAGFLLGNQAEITVVALVPTSLVLDIPAQREVGRPINVTGALLAQMNPAIPAPGAAVLLRYGDSVSQATTNAGGRFSHTLTAPATESLTVTALFGGGPELARSEASLTIPLLFATRLTLAEPERQGRNYRVAGSLETTDGQPVSNTQVKLELLDDAGTALAVDSAATDAQGRFVQDLDAEGQPVTLARASFDGAPGYAAAPGAAAALPAPGQFNWVWLLAPLFLALGGVGGFLGFRLLQPLRAPASPVRRAPAAAGGVAAPPPAVTQLLLTPRLPAFDLPPVWGRGETIILDGWLRAETDAPLNGRMIRVQPGGGAPAGDFTADANGQFAAQLAPPALGAYRVAAHYAGEPGYLPARAELEIRVVDFRAEVIRLYNEFLAWARSRASITDRATPREVETILVREGRIGDERGLEQVIARFEEADYSEHPVARPQYEAMFRAWRAVRGEQSA